MAHHSISKAKAQQSHAMTRVRQRYGLELNRDDYEKIVSIIKTAGGGNNRKAQFITRQSNRVSVWKVLYAERELVAVYDRLRKKICTFLPPECISPDAITWRSAAPSDYWAQFSVSGSLSEILFEKHGDSAVYA